MGKILCATRGCEVSCRTQDEAIALAKERGDELVFLYVVDIQFLDKTAAPIVVDVENEVTKMGEFLLLMARSGRPHRVLRRLRSPAVARCGRS